MLTKFDTFMRELTLLCSKYDYELSTSGYDAIEVWNTDKEHPSLQGWECIVEDKTGENK